LSTKHHWYTYIAILGPDNAEFRGLSDVKHDLQLEYITDSNIEYIQAVNDYPFWVGLSSCLIVGLFLRRKN